MNLLGIVGLFVLSFLLGRGVISLARRFNLGADSAPGVQKFHSHWVPRLGGVPIFLALALWIAFTTTEIQPDATRPIKWLICLLPAFAAGLLEDLTARIGSWPRLLATMTSAALAWWLVGAQITRLGPDVLDGWLQASPLLSLAVTMLFVGGGAHALNIIDGYNGLASSFALIVLFAILVVANQVGDIKIVYLASGAIAATLGFFVLNFPHGRIFMGDSGAYLLGTVIGLLLAVLVARNPQVSPMFAAVLLVYPVWETLFSMYRKKVLRGQSPMQPDGLHLHMLLYKRLVRSHQGSRSGERKVLMNSATTLYALSMSVGTAVMAMTFWQNDLALLVIFALFIAGYVWLYSALVRFQVPQRLSLRQAWGGEINVPALALKVAQAAVPVRGSGKRRLPEMEHAPVGVAPAEQ